MENITIESIFRNANRRLCWRLVRVLLWLIRRLGFMLECDGMVYEWVSDSLGGFDHWLVVDGQVRDLGCDVLLYCCWPFIWFILRDSKLLTGDQRQSHWEQILFRSEEYYCAAPIGDIREQCRRK